MSNTSNLLQQAYVLATGNAADAGTLAQFEAMVEQDGGFGRVAALVESAMTGIAASQGLAATVKALALNGLGVVLTDQEAVDIKAALAAGGVVSWADIFVFCITLQGGVGTVLDNRANAAEHFNEALATAGKADLFSGATVSAAVHNMLLNIGGSDQSAANGVAGMDAIVAQLGAGGLSGEAIDGYLTGATVFIDTDGNGQLGEGEFHTTTDASGHYTLPADAAAGTVVVTGGEDMLTGKSFQGTFSATAGALQVSPFTTVVQAMVAGGIAASPLQGTDALTAALGLPPGVNLLTYDPLAVLANKNASAADKSIAFEVESISIQLANVLVELAAVIHAANPDAPHAAATVAAALAAAINAGPLDLTTAAGLQGIVEAAANAAGAPTVLANANAIATIIAAGNAEAADASDITTLAQVAVVTQGAAVDQLESAGAAGDFTGALHDLTGHPLDLLIHGAHPGDIAPGVPVPTAGSPAVPFAVSVDKAGVVHMQGTATGDITVSWAGTPGDSIATFTRSGFTAGRHPDFSADASSIALDAGDRLVATAEQVTGVTIDGAGSVAITDTALDAANLLDIDSHVFALVNVSAATAVTGTAADLAADYASSGITGLGDEDLIVTDTALTASALNGLDAATTGVVTVSAATAISGAAADVVALYASSGFDGLGDEEVTPTDVQLDAAALRTIDLATSSMVHAAGATGLAGTADDVAADYASKGIDGLGDEAVTLTDTTLAAGTLLVIDTATSGAIDAQAAQTLTGSADDVTAAFAANKSGTVTGLGDEAVTLSDVTLAAATLNTVDAATSGVVDATAADTLTGASADVIAAYAANTAGTVKGLGTEAVTLSDTTLAVADLVAIDAATVGVVDAGLAATLTGRLSQVAAAYAAGSSAIGGLGNEAVTLSNKSINAAELVDVDAATTGTIDASKATLLHGSAAAVANAYASSGITGLGDEDVTLTNPSTVSAANFAAIGLATSGVIDASSVTTIVGAAADVLAVYTATPGHVTGLGDEAVTLKDNNLDAGALHTIDLATSGVVDVSGASALTGAIADLVADYTAATTDITGLGDENVNLTDTLAGASDLVTLDSKTTGTVKAGSVLALDGAAADVLTALASTGITGLGNEAVTLSDSALTTTTLQQLDTATSGTVDATSVKTLAGLAADVLQLHGAAGVIGLGAEAVTLADTLLAATVLANVDTATTGVVDAGSVLTLTGAANAVRAAYDAQTAGGIKGLGDEAVTLSGATGVGNDLAAIDAATTGTIDASSYGTISGNANTVAAIYASSGFSGLGDENVTLNNLTLNAATLNTIDAATKSGVVDASAATTLTGSASDVLTAYAAQTAGTVSGLGGNENITLTDNSLSASALTAIDGKTSGVVDASGANTLTGTAVEVKAAYDAQTALGVSGLGDEKVTLAGATADADALAAIDKATSGVINASSATTLQGLAANLLAAYASSEINGLGNEAVTVTDSTLAAASLDTIDSKTSGIVNASAATTLTGLAADVAAAYAGNTAGRISGLNNEAVTLDDASLLAATFNTVRAATSGAIDASTATSVTGTYNAVISMYGASGVTGLGNETITLTNASLSVLNLNSADGLTGGVVDASQLGTLTGLIGALLTAHAAAGITGLGGEAITLNNTSLLASDLKTLDTKTTGLIDAGTATSVSGTLADLAAVYTSSGITGLGNESVTVTDTTLLAASLNTLNSKISTSITVTAATTLQGSAADVALAYTGGGLTGLGNEAVTIEGSSAVAADLLAVNTKTSGTINAALPSLLTGAAADIEAVFVANDGTQITGLSADATINDTTVDAGLLYAIRGHAAALTDATSLTELTGSAADVLHVMSGYAGGTIDLGAVDIVLDDSSLTATTLASVRSESGDDVDATALDTLTGTAAEVSGLFADKHVTGLGDVNINLTDSDLDAAALLALDGKTTGTVDVTGVTSLTGFLGDIDDAFNAGGVSGFAAQPVTLSDGSVNATDLIALDTELSGNIDVGKVITISGTATDLQTIEASSGIVDKGAVGLSINDTSVDADVLNTFAAATTGDVSAVFATTITGGAKALLSALPASNVILTNGFDVTVTDTAVAADALTSVATATSGDVTATDAAVISGTPSQVTAALGTANLTLSPSLSVDISDTAANLDKQSFSATTGSSDSLTVSDSPASALDLTGFTGFETIHLQGSTGKITLPDGANTAVSASAAVVVQLGAGGQVFHGSAFAETVFGWGADTVTLGNGADVFQQGIGHATVNLADTDSATDIVVMLSAMASASMNVTGFVSGQDKIYTSIFNLGLDGADYATGGVTFKTVAQTAGFTTADWNNYVLADSHANLVAYAGGGSTGAVLAYETDTGKVLYDNNGDFTDGGTVTIATVGLGLAAGDFNVVP